MDDSDGMEEAAHRYLADYGGPFGTLPEAVRVQSLQSMMPHLELQDIVVGGATEWFWLEDDADLSKAVEFIKSAVPGDYFATK